MIRNDQVKILGDKIKSNQAQYDLGREAAKISALCSKQLLEKYEYLTGEDLGHRPNALAKTKFEYSPLSRFFNKGLKEADKKEGPLKILKILKMKVKSS